jgi:glycosyltransferase involved in cell wall biosynthesis
VDDKSADNTSAEIKKLQQQYPFIVSLFHERNKGRGAAVKTGIEASQGAVVGFMDIDMEISPIYLSQMMKAMDSGCDVVTIKRRYEWSSSAFIAYRHFLSIGYKRLSKFVLGIPYEDTETGFKFFKRDPLMEIIKHSKFDGWFWDTEIMVLAWKNKLNVVEIDGAFVRRTDKVSSVNGIRDSFVYIIDLLKFKFFS